MTPCSVRPHARRNVHGRNVQVNKVVGSSSVGSRKAFRVLDGKGMPGYGRVVIALLLLTSIEWPVSYAAENPRLKKEMQAIRAVVEENFRASNLEDVDAVMATMTPYTPNRDRFIEELKQFFNATDVYARLIDVSFVSAEVTNYGPIATVKVVQQTLPKGDAGIPYSEFRTRSAMLPPWEVCEYEVVLHKIRGKWLAHLIGGDVREAQLPAADEGEATRTSKVR